MFAASAAVFHVFLAAFVYSSSNDLDKTQFEAAFQGRCGHESPCEQLCYELHDGIIECDCHEGFLLHQDGYSCVELNTTMETLREEAEMEEDVLYQKGASFSAQLIPGPAFGVSPTDSGSSAPATRSRRVGADGQPQFSQSPQPCDDCGQGNCLPDSPRCQCPLGTTGHKCQTEVDVHTPGFSGQGWLAFPALKAAYKHVQLEIEFRPEVPEGILFLTGERDDLAGDFMALLIHQGFVEFRFDCGSGVGVVRSFETVLLNQWNRLTVYRHRWDAWIQLNNGKQVQGRSKGLFSRMTFREPVFIGGRGNTSGLQEKLPTDHGFKGCIRHLQINDYNYKFAAVPKGDAIKGFDIDDCIADRCSKVPCKHGGKCLTSGDTAVCLCPLGFTGDLCESRLDLQVPSFNGSSFLRLPGLGSSALSWLDISIVVKPSSHNGLILYNGHKTDGMGDFIALYLVDGHVEFTFDLGTGAATLRSAEYLSSGEWHEIKISRTGRLAVLQVNKNPSVQILSPEAFTQLYLPLNLYVGGISNFDIVSPKVKTRTSFVGCIQRLAINYRLVQMLTEALAGVNVNNCAHPCVAKPCGDVASCVPHFNAFKCVCDKHCEETNEQAKTNHVASFTGNTYLHYIDPEILSRILANKVSINMRFRTTSPNGLITWTGRNEMKQTFGDFLALGIKDGYLHLRYNLGSGETLIVFNETRVDDGNWHRVKVMRSEQEGYIAVDHGKPITARSPGRLKQLNTNTGLFIGGMEDMDLATLYKYHKGFQGCISEMTLNSEYHVKLAWSADASNHCGDIPP
ncbi:Laminin G domain [Nesidiocoris tenuis]|uniref:Laminin G domain n=1 Tax=Nesidiocoris tenuis TaxID=355587 RepID=A0ABN7AF43_9HEMI|nr:Laminin G domain [Nesidiocoris tenuis]